MVSRLNLGIELDAAAGRAQRTLRNILRPSTDAAALRTKALYGALGFCLGTGLVFTGLAAASALVYAPFLVPLAGVAGILGGALAGRDAVDWDNERIEELVEQVWKLRDREIKDLKTLLKAAPRGGAERARLSDRITTLALAPPQELCVHYGLVVPELTSGRLVRRSPAEDRQKALPAPGVPMTSLADMRVPAEPDR